MVRRDHLGRKITPGAEASRPSHDSPTPDTSPSPAARRPEFKVDRANPGRGSASWTSKCFVIVSLLALGGGLIYTGWSSTRRPDPHYLEARKMVIGYELGKSAESKNFGNAVYHEALDELAQVDPDSVSAQPAAALRVRIEADQAEFEQEQEARRRNNTKIVEVASAREKAIRTAHIQRLVNPVTEFPECDE